MRTVRFLAIAALLLGAWTPPLPAGAGDPLLTRVQERNDFHWVPPAYSLSTVDGAGSVPVSSLNGLTSTTTGPTTAQCLPALSQRLAEGACTGGSRAVSYSDGCGGTLSRTESCPSGTWSYFYRGIGGGDGWINTSSVVKLACVSPGTSDRLPDAHCGTKPGPDLCRIGQSAVSSVPECSPAPSWTFASAPNFWGAGAIASCIAGC